MRTLPLAIAVLLLAALGCRSDNNQLLVEQESRMWESAVYDLEAELGRVCQEREALLAEVASLRGGGSPPPSSRSGGGSSSTTPYSPPARRSTPPSRSSGPPNVPLEAPTIELPEATDTPPDSLIPGAEQPALPSPGDGGAVNGRPTHLSINRRLTGGMDRDGEPGDEGIMVMVEPRDAQGRLIKAPGAVSVVVMDPTQQDDASRVARWDFQAHEFDEHFKSSTFGHGLQYELAWPGNIPANRDLVVFVRYINPDGTKVTADAPLSIRLASDERPAATVSSDAEQGRGSRIEAEGDDSPRALSAAEEAPRRKPIGPRQARDGRPQWKPYR